MNPELWQRVLTLWDEAKAVEAAELGAFLDERCSTDPRLRQELESLLGHHRAHEVSRETLAEAVQDLSPASWAAALSPGDRLGAFRVENELGRGGMGVVYRARREGADFEQVVAIKLLHPVWAGSHLEARFVEERKILAALDHPGIARLIDGGKTGSGLLYVVMDLVEGETLTVHCQRRRLGLEERLALFREVCVAVDYAHGQLVVHRDLKPGNLLVDGDGAVKLLDFGIAKLLSEGADAVGLTVTGGSPFTFAYASPEQIRGARITVASDVYSLGVVLFELLTGVRPRDCAPDSSTRREGTAGVDLEKLPSQVSDAELGVDAQTLRGDLDAILTKTLRGHPAERYSSVRELIEDLDRFRDGLPVRARHARPLYRLKKFIRRNRLASALAAVLLLTVLGFSGQVWSNSRALARERDEAESQRAAVEQSLSFLEGIFEGVQPANSEAPVIDPSALLEPQVERARASFADEPLVRSRLLVSLARLYSSLGLYREARDLLGEAGELRAGILGVDHPDTVDLRSTVGRLELALDDVEAAERLLGSALANQRRSLSPDDLRLANTLESLSELHFRKGDYPLAKSYAEECLAIRRKSLGESHPLVADAWIQMATAAMLQGELAEAEDHARRAWQVSRAARGEGSYHAGSNLARLGRIQLEQGEFGAARETLEQALEILRAVLGPEHGELAAVRENLAIVLGQLGDLRAAEGMLREVLRSQTARFGLEHARTSDALLNLAACLRDQGHLETAEGMMVQALEIRRRVDTQTHPKAGIILNQLGNVARELRRYDVAVARSQEALEIQEAILGDEHTGLVSTLVSLGRARALAGRFDPAQQALERALGIARSHYSETSIRFAFVRRAQADLALATGELGTAEALYRELLDRYGPEGKASDPFQARLFRELAVVLLAMRREDDAAEAVQNAREILSPIRQTRMSDWWQTLSIGGAIEARRGSRRKAEELLLAGYEGLSVPGQRPSRVAVAALERLIAAYDFWGETERAAVHRARLREIADSGP